MNLQELKNKMSVSHANGYNSYKVTITYRGKEYSCISNNSTAYDSLYAETKNDLHFCRSVKDAWLQLYNECKRKNDLA